MHYKRQENVEMPGVSGSSLNCENLPVWKMFPFLDEREKYKICPSSGNLGINYV